MMLPHRPGSLFPDPEITVETAHKVATYSLDHIHPLGTATDNTRHPWFVAASALLFNGPLSVLDIGCSGGGIVFDFLQHGHNAIGIEGSDYSFLQRRAY